MKFSVSGHDLIRLATAIERVDAVAEGFRRVAADDQSVFAIASAVSADHGRRGRSLTGLAGPRRVIRV